MIIRDMKAYRRTQAEEFGQENEQLDEKNPFFRAVAGKKRINSHVETLANFATNIEYQFFYELLQNASDALASNLHIYYDNNQLLILNNGDFFTNENLFSFLGKNNSDKIDNNKAGKYGQGSKLLYTLLFSAKDVMEKSKKMAKEIIDNKKSIVIFSWSKAAQFESFKTFADTSKLVFLDNEDAPILTKPIYTFFPANVGEIKEIDGQSIDLFPASDIIKIQKFLSKNSFPFGHIHTAAFEKGSLFYLELGEGVGEKIKKIEEEVVQDLQMALNFFPAVKKVVINNRVVDRFSGNKIEGKINVESDIVDFSFVYKKNNLPTKVNVDFATNFYRFAPAYKEKYGFDFCIHSFFEVKDDRQEIQWDIRQKKILEQIIVKVIEQLNKYKKEGIDVFLPLYNAFLFSELSEKNTLSITNKVFLEVYQVIKQQILDCLKNNIPTQNNKFLPKTQVKIKKTNLDFDLSDFVSDQNWLFIPENQTDTQKFEDRCKGILGLETWNICQIIAELEQNTQAFEAYIQQLPPKEYQAFLAEINEHFDANSAFLTLKIFKGNDNNWYAIEDYCDNNTNFWLLDIRKDIQSMRDLFTRQGFVFANNVDLFTLSNLNPFVLDNFSNNQLFDKLTHKIQAQNLHKEDKMLLISNLALLAETNQAQKDKIAELAYFKHEGNPAEYVGLKAVGASKFRTGNPEFIPRHRILAEYTSEEQKDNFDKYTTENIYENFIQNEWAKWLPTSKPRLPITSKLVASFYDFIDKVYTKNNEINPPNTFAAFFTKEGDFISKDNAIAIKYEDSEHEAVNDLLAKLSLSISNNANRKRVLHLDLRENYYHNKGTLFHIPLDLLEILPDSISLEKKEVFLLFSLLVKNGETPFEVVYCKAENGKFRIYNIAKNADKPRQCTAQEPHLVEFLTKNEEVFVLLPKELGELGKKYTAEPADVSKLIKYSEYDFEKAKAFAWSVNEAQNQDLRKSYIGKMPILFDLIPKGYVGQAFEKNSFERVFANILDVYASESTANSAFIKNNVHIFGYAISEVQYNEAVSLNTVSYALSELLPDEFGDKVGLLERAKELLGNGNFSHFLKGEDYGHKEIFAHLFTANTLSLQQYTFFLEYAEMYKKDISANMQKINKVDLIRAEHTQAFEKNTWEVHFADAANAYLNYAPSCGIKSKIFVDGVALDQLLYKEEVILENDKNDKYTLSILLPKYLPNARLQQRTKCILPNEGRLTHLLKIDDKPHIDILNELASQIIDNIQQFGYLVASSSITDKHKNALAAYANAHNQETLEYLFRKENTKWQQQKFQYTGWILKETALVAVQNNNLLLPEEKLPDWVAKWIGTDAVKIEYLHDCGVKNDEIIDFRLFVKNTENAKPEISKLDIFWAENHLSWLMQQNKTFSQSADKKILDMLFKYLPEYYEKIAPANIVDKVYFVLNCIKYVSEKEAQYQLIRMDKGHKYAYFKDNFKTYLPKAIEKIQAKKYFILTEKVKGIKELKNAGFNLSEWELTQSVNSKELQNKAKEWGEWEKAPQYSVEWKKDHSQRIFISKELIPNDFFAESNGEQIPLETCPEGKAAQDGKKYYLSEALIAEKESVEYALAALNPTDFAKVEEFNKEALLALSLPATKNKNTTTADLNPNTSENLGGYAGGVQNNTENTLIPAFPKHLEMQNEEGKWVKSDALVVTEAESRLIDMLQDAGVDAALLAKLLKNKDKKPKNEAQINEKTGKAGEKIIYEYLRQKYPEPEYVVEWSSRYKNQHAYDFKVHKKGDENEVIYIDAKTTGVSELTPDAIPFYLHKNSMRFLRGLQKSEGKKYILARLNLQMAKDLGVKIKVTNVDEWEFEYEFDLGKDDNFQKLENIIDFMNLSLIDKNIK